MQVKPSFMLPSNNPAMQYAMASFCEALDVTDSWSINYWGQVIAGACKAHGLPVTLAWQDYFAATHPRTINI